MDEDQIDDSGSWRVVKDSQSKRTFQICACVLDTFASCEGPGEEGAIRSGRLALQSVHKALYALPAGPSGVNLVVK